MTDLDALAALEAAVERLSDDQQPIAMSDVWLLVDHAPALIDAARRVQAVEAERDELRADCSGLERQANELGDIVRRDTEEIARLRAWKAEAAEVLTRWDAVYEALGGPGPVGQFKSSNALAEVKRLQQAERDLSSICDNERSRGDRARAALARIDTDETRQAVAEALESRKHSYRLTDAEVRGIADAAVRAVVATITDTTEETDRG